MKESRREYKLLQNDIIKMALKEIEKKQLLGQQVNVTIDNIYSQMIKEVTDYVNQND